MIHKIKNKDILRFWSYVEKTDDCWLWTGYKTNNGYGRFWFSGKPTLVHRFSYELHYGEIPADKVICHSCDVRNCIRPEHLFCGTHQDNVNDRDKKGRQKSIRGEKHHSVKVPDYLVKHAILLYNNTEMTHQAIADMLTGMGYPCSDSTIGRWVKGFNRIN